MDFDYNGNDVLIEDRKYKINEVLVWIKDELVSFLYYYIVDLFLFLVNILLLLWLKFIFKFGFDFWWGWLRYCFFYFIMFDFLVVSCSLFVVIFKCVKFVLFLFFDDVIEDILLLLLVWFELL